MVEEGCYSPRQVFKVDETGAVIQHSLASTLTIGEYNIS
jgi:hypothetical protein